LVFHNWLYSYSRLGAAPPPYWAGAGG
jgi:hypothetical protein